MEPDRAIEIRQSKEIPWQEKRKEMFTRVRQWSEDFIKKTSHPDGAFHSYRHFENVVVAGRRYLEKVNGSDRGTDPLNFWGDLETYCKDNGLGQNYFSSQDLEIAIDLFGMSHDLGNMFKSFKKDLTPVPNTDRNGNTIFSKNGAENRSKGMLESFANNFFSNADIPSNKKSQIISLVKTWITETDLRQTDQKRTFNKFAQGIDQLGYSLIDNELSPSQYTQIQKNLLNEELYDPKGMRFTSDDLTPEQILFRFANFTQNTLTRLTGQNIEKQKQLIKIFTGKEELPKHLTYEADDPRLNDLRSHILYRIKQRLTKQIDSDIEHQNAVNLNAITRGAIHEAIAESVSPENGELLPFQEEICDILQNPKKYGFKRHDFEKIGDVVNVKLSKNGYIIIESVYEAKSSGDIDERGREQINGGIQESMENLCRKINAMDIAELKEKKLFYLAKLKETLPKGSLALAIHKDFKVILILPNGETVSGVNVEVINTNYSKNQIRKIAEVFLANFPSPKLIKI